MAGLLALARARLAARPAQRARAARGGALAAARRWRGARCSCCRSTSPSIRPRAGIGGGAGGARLRRLAARRAAAVRLARRARRAGRTLGRLIGDPAPGPQRRLDRGRGGVRRLAARGARATRTWRCSRVALLVALARAVLRARRPAAAAGLAARRRRRRLPARPGAALRPRRVRRRPALPHEHGLQARLPGLAAARARRDRRAGVAARHGCRAAACAAARRRSRLARSSPASLVYPLAGTYARKDGFDRTRRRSTASAGCATARPATSARSTGSTTRRPAGAVVLESVGDDYSAFGHARISTFTGLPTVLGWPGPRAAVGPRRRHAARPTSRRSTSRRRRPRPRELLRRYGVRYVVVGPLELHGLRRRRRREVGRLGCGRERVLCEAASASRDGDAGCWRSRGGRLTPEARAVADAGRRRRRGMPARASSTRLSAWRT